MNIWDFIVYFSIGVCYITALLVAIGWIKHAKNK